MALDKKISQLATDAAPARADYLTSLEGGSLNVKALISAILALVQDTDLNFTDNTAGDGNVLTHGFMPKLSGDVTQYLNGLGGYTIPGGSTYLQYRDEQAQNTAGGTFTSGAWRTRTLNTEVSDVGGFGSLASNQITLTAGTYLIAASAPARLVDRHQLRLQNVTDATTLVVGQSVLTPSGTSGDVGFASLRGIFTVAASKALELQHQGQTTQATNGFGVAANFTTEVYAVVELWKIG